ncbi:hypothetical protein D3C86_1908420 [compost metagenome]
MTFLVRYEEIALRVDGEPGGVVGNHERLIVLVLDRLDAIAGNRDLAQRAISPLLSDIQVIVLVPGDAEDVDEAGIGERAILQDD